MIQPRFWSAALLMCATAAVSAQSLWKSGNWTLQSPPTGNCGSLPLLEIKGPGGSIFDPPNTSALSELQAALPAALARSCPGTREVVLVSGKTRRLMKLAEVVASPVENNAAVRTQAAADAPVIATTKQVLVAAPRSELKSLAAARSIEDKCDVLFSWLESSKSQGAPSAGYRYGAPSADVLRIFRDESMIAVFGMPYDKSENRWRLEMHEKTLSRCLGLPSQQRFGGQFSGIVRPSGPSQTMQKLSQQFAQYQAILNQAFLGQPGAFEPTQITRHIQQVRAQFAWANQSVASASGAPATRQSFDNIGDHLKSSEVQMALLDASEKSQVVSFLKRRQTEIAPEIVDRWFQEASQSQKTLASAQAVSDGYENVGPVLRVLDTSTRSVWSGKYKTLMDSLLTDSVQTETAKLSAIPATLSGIPALTSWKASFDESFGPFRDVTSVDGGLFEYSRTQSRILSGALPSWLVQVNALPMEAPPIAAKRNELEKLFSTAATRSATAYVQYEQPLKSKEDQLRVIIATEMRNKQIAAARQSGGPVTLDGFLAKGLDNEAALTMLFTGEIDNLGFDREDTSFAALLKNYLEAFWDHCKQDLPPPPNRAEIMSSECETYRTTTNLRTGVETSRTCVSYRDVHTGRFAKTELYAASKEMTRQSAANVGRIIGTMFGQIAQGDPLSAMRKQLGTAIAIRQDVYTLVQRYAEAGACKSPALLRFEENIRLFAINRTPLKLDGKTVVSSVTVPIPGVPYKDQNYERLIDALVTDDSKRWGVFSQFVRGSISGASVTSRDEFGRPTQVEAGYLHNDFDRNGKRGTVILKFTDGLPHCLAYSDAIPTPTCHTPNRKIVSTYEQGGFPQ